MAANGVVSARDDACPQCRCTHLLVLGAYRKCVLCGWKGTLDDASQKEIVV